MLTFKQFNEARDPRETIHHLEKLANHPNTGEHEATSARAAAARLRAAHNIPHETSTDHIDRPDKAWDDHGKRQETEHKRPSQQPKGTVWKYKKTKTGRTGKTTETFGSIHKKSDTSYATEHREKPTRYHKSFYAAHEHLMRHGYEPN